jgi:hypothetical protein
MDVVRKKITAAHSCSHFSSETLLLITTFFVYLRNDLKVL